MKKILKLITALVFVLLVPVIVGAAITPWAEPTAAPPGNNVSAPINVSSNAQTKSGNLSVTGNVGIGLSNPGQKLEVYGAGLFNWAGGSNGTVYLGDANHGIKATSGSGVTVFSYAVPNGIFLQQSTGNVGFGTASPTYKLTTVGTGGALGMDNQATLGAKNTSGAYETWMWPRWSDNVMYTNYGSAGWNIRNNASTNTMFLTNDGSVGIGTLSPGAKLDVQGTFAANFGTTSQCCGGTNPTLSLAEATSGNNRLPGIQFHASGFQEAFIRLAKDARVFEMGDNQAVGTSLALLNGSGTRNIYMNPSGGAYGLGSIRLGYQTLNSNSNGWLYMGNSSYSVYGGQGLAADNLWANTSSYAGAFYYTSDAALKENIAPLTGSLEKITQLNGVSFNWTETGKPSIGLVAQDVEKIFPDMVTTNTANGYKSVDYGKLVAPLIEAVKTQQQEISELRTRIEELESLVEKTGE